MAERASNRDLERLHRQTGWTLRQFVQEVNRIGTERGTPMMSAASDLCYLTGYMAVDEGLQGLAQQYYLKALELAGASEDLTYCTTLRGMSVQAVDLGHGPEAMRLADAAAAASPQAGSRMRAFLAGQQVHAAAQVGDRGNALRHLREAEIAMEKAEARQRAFGSYDPSALHYRISHVITNSVTSPVPWTP